MNTLKKIGKVLLVVAAVVLGLLLFEMAYLSLRYSPEYMNREIFHDLNTVYDYRFFAGRKLAASPDPFSFAGDTSQEPLVQEAFQSRPKIDDLDALLEETDTQAFLVIQDDNLIYERYFKGQQRDSLVTSFSVAKSFTSALIGIAIHEGIIKSVDDPVTDLYTSAPSCGAQVSVLANHLNQGMGQLVHRVGYANRRVLAAEWVLPTGEILRTGSAAVFGDYFWGEGPGPDLRGLMRGWFGHYGGMGIVTKIAVKLFHLPFRGIPEQVGITPRTAFKLPEDRFKWFVLYYPDSKKAVDAMYEIGHAEIAAVVVRIAFIWRYIARAGSRNEFWDQWVKAEPALSIWVPPEPSVSWPALSLCGSPAPRSPPSRSPRSP